jgi:hypothetical protein
MSVAIRARCVVRATLLPELQLDHQIHALSLAHRGDAVEIFDAEDAEPAHLMWCRKSRRLPEDHARWL